MECIVLVTNYGNTINFKIFRAGHDGSFSLIKITFLSHYTCSNIFVQTVIHPPIPEHRSGVLLDNNGIVVHNIFRQPMST